MEQVFVNLIMTPLISAGGGTLTIRAYLRDSTNTWEAWPGIAKATCSKSAKGPDRGIEDGGPEIPQEILDKIFDPFSRTRARGRGDRVGLAVLKIITLHNGASRSQTGRMVTGQSNSFLKLEQPSALSN